MVAVSSRASSRSTHRSTHRSREQRVCLSSSRLLIACTFLAVGWLAVLLSMARDLGESSVIDGASRSSLALQSKVSSHQSVSSANKERALDEGEESSVIDDDDDEPIIDDDAEEEDSAADDDAEEKEEEEEEAKIDDSLDEPITDDNFDDEGHKPATDDDDDESAEEKQAADDDQNEDESVANDDDDNGEEEEDRPVSEDDDEVADDDDNVEEQRQATGDDANEDEQATKDSADEEPEADDDSVEEPETDDDKIEDPASEDSADEEIVIADDSTRREPVTDNNSEAVNEDEKEEEEEEEEDDDGGEKEEEEEEEEEQDDEKDDSAEETATGKDDKSAPGDKTEGTTTLAGLSCKRFGGPDDRHAAEMVYWKDIESDAQYVSPFKKKGVAQYLTFEPDEGGWNNIRMAMETVLALAFATGRTLVLPPEDNIYLLSKGKNKHGKQRNKFTFNHFFHMQAINKEHPGLDIITMEEFLEREAMTGNFRDKHGKLSFPPGNVTKWDGLYTKKLYQWLRETSNMALWQPERCIAVFPSSPDRKDIKRLKANFENDILKNQPRWQDYVGNPVPINASAMERMRENLAGRSEMCLYDKAMQASRFLHFPVDNKLDARLLVHFYAFLFFQDWKQDLWMKRFIRDHVRYIDEIQCAAARVVAAVRKRARKRDPAKNAEGHFDSFHIRRGDFQYKDTRLTAEKILRKGKKKIKKGSTVFIATDERDKSFFDPLKKYYNVVFLDDFHEALGPINSNYYGMIDQLVASKGRYFIGCWLSTFTGYINRLRGYRHYSAKQPGYETGVIPSWYYALDRNFNEHQTYHPLKEPLWAQEFPTSWRLIDSSVESA